MQNKNIHNMEVKRYLPENNTCGSLYRSNHTEEVLPRYHHGNRSDSTATNNDRLNERQILQQI